MISLKKRNQGFTIVELLIVIVVIGILALLVITTYSGIQQKARNSKRQTDVKSLQTQLEAFFSENGYYPSRTDMNDSASSTGFVQKQMKGLDLGALTDPSNPTQSKTLAAAPTAKSYAYQPVQSDGTTDCESDHTTCAQYTLTATYEGTVNGQTTFVKKNLD
jgi:prepilin-type N-terminal cleavage/methylation domain-containing protein